IGERQRTSDEHEGFPEGWELWRGRPRLAPNAVGVATRSAWKVGPGEYRSADRRGNGRLRGRPPRCARATRGTAYDSPLVSGRLRTNRLQVANRSDSSFMPVSPRSQPSAWPIARAAGEPSRAHSTTSKPAARHISGGNGQWP